MHYEPMLAQKFEKYKDKLSWPVITQRKSDGIRAVITKDGAMSRMGKSIRQFLISLRHLNLSSKSILMQFLMVSCTIMHSMMISIRLQA